MAHMRSHLDETLASSDALPRTSTTATVDSIPPCAGCLPGTCTTRELVLRKLAQGGWKEGFEQAMANGWRGLWDFGMSAAQSLSAMNKPHCAYCFLMNIATLNRWDADTVDRMRRNLALLRDNTANS